MKKRTRRTHLAMFKSNLALAAVVAVELGI